MVSSARNSSAPVVQEGGLSLSHPAQTNPGKGKESFLDCLPFAFLIAASCLVLTWSRWAPHYEGFDDLAMSFIASGATLTGVPNQHILDSNVILGLFLQRLYQFNHNIAWYAFYLSGARLLALTCICSVLLSKGKKMLGALGFVVFYAVAEAGSSINWQFTSTAVLVGQAGFLCLLRGLPDNQRALLARPPVLFGLALLLFSSLIRFESVCLALLLGGAFLLVAFLWRKKRSYLWGIGLLVACLSICLALESFNAFYYSQSPQWHGYLDFVKAKFAIVDCGRVTNSQAHQQALQQMGMTKVDLEAFREYMYEDDRLFSLARLQKLLQLCPFTPHSFKDPALQEIIKTWDTTIFRQFAVLLAAAFLLIRRKADRYQFLAWMTFALSVPLVLAYLAKLEYRVYYPIVSFAEMLLLYFVCQNSWLRFMLRKAGTSTNYKLGAVTIGAAIVLLSVFWTYRLNLQWATRCETTSRQFLNDLKEMKRTLPFSPNTMVVSLSGCLPIFGLNPLEDPQKYLPPSVLYSFFSRTPISHEQLKQHGYKSMFQAMHSDDVYVISYDWVNDVYIKYMAQHYGLNLRPCLVFRSPSFWVFQFKPDS